MLRFYDGDRAELDDRGAGARLNFALCLLGSVAASVAHLRETCPELEPASPEDTSLVRA